MNLKQTTVYLSDSMFILGRVACDDVLFSLRGQASRTVNTRWVGDILLYDIAKCVLDTSEV